LPASPDLGLHTTTAKLRRLPFVVAAGISACVSASPYPDELPDVLPRLRTDARATASAGRLEIRFPSIALANAGCMSLDSTEIGVRRTYQWHATTQFHDSEYPANHFMGLYIFFNLPDSVLLTAERLDSVLTRLPITVDEAAGEPPMSVRKVEPRNTRASWNGRQVVLRVEDPVAVQEFLRARSDSVDIGWCQRDENLTATRVRLNTRP
jgi:hypothetical protein